MSRHRFYLQHEVFTLYWIIGLVFSACSTTKNTTHSKYLTSPLSTENLYREINKKPNISYFRINSKIDIQAEKWIPPLSTTIYIEKDKKIWMNAQASFFNVARVLVTREGIQGYDRFNKLYIKSDFGYLNELLNTELINFDVLQNLIIGRTFFPIAKKDYVWLKTGADFLFSSSQPQKFETENKEYLYTVDFLYNASLDLKRVRLVELNSDNALQIEYTNWTTIGSVRLPKNLLISVKGKKNTTISMENNHFDFNAMETPFSIPNNYRKTEIK
ncbi:MAG: DUF4292 domain-containing protein [Bergeyella sp.]|nr:DUF4292 domain-containing protein [Bergeyella sp.]